LGQSFTVTIEKQTAERGKTFENRLAFAYCKNWDRRPKGGVPGKTKP